VTATLVKLYGRSSFEAQRYHRHPEVLGMKAITPSGARPRTRTTHRHPEVLGRRPSLEGSVRSLRIILTQQPGRSSFEAQRYRASHLRMTERGFAARQLMMTERGFAARHLRMTEKASLYKKKPTQDSGKRLALSHSP
jgi:hypothetical protein